MKVRGFVRIDARAARLQLDSNDATMGPEEASSGDVKVDDRKATIG